MKGTILILSICLYVQAYYLTLGDDQPIPIPSYSHPSFNEKVKLDVESESGEKYKLELKRPARTVLHPNLKFIRIDRDLPTGQDTWSPSNHELNAAQNIYVDENHSAVVRRSETKNGEKFHGVANGMRLEMRDGVATLRERPSNHSSDYIDFGRNLTYAKSQKGGIQYEKNDAVVELVLVCDKEWGDVFQHDRQAILDYFTIYFWEVNMNFKSLPSSNVSFRITAIIVFSNLKDQKFIEKTRDAEGRANLNEILDNFSYWIYEQTPHIPKYDLAAIITNTDLTWRGGLAYLRSPCAPDDKGRFHWGVLTFNDDGAWGSTVIGTHELGHSMGAPHDDDENYPGGCDYRGYIMSGSHWDKRWFFSPCSDRTISNFVRSDQADCTRSIDNPDPAIEPSFDSVLAPTMLEQCRRWLRDPKASISDTQNDDCVSLACWTWVKDGGYWLIYYFAQLDNSPCGEGGRCFRGRCRQPGKLIVNVATGRCMKATNPFSNYAAVEMTDCPSADGGNPLNRFVLMPSDNGQGFMLATPYAFPDASENADKCIYTDNDWADYSQLWTGRCHVEGTWRDWDLVKADGSEEFMLRHRDTGRCPSYWGNAIKTSRDLCDISKDYNRWRLE